MGTGFVGVVFVIFFVDRIVGINQERERQKRQSVAFRQLRKTLKNHLTLLFCFYKDTNKALTWDKFINVSDVFKDAFFHHVVNFDFGKKTYISIAAERYQYWYDYIPLQFHKFLNSLNETIAKYILFINIEIIDLMEEIVQSDFIEFMLSLESLPMDIHLDHNFFALNVEKFKEYIRLIDKLVYFYNENVSEQQKLYANQFQWKFL